MLRGLRSCQSARDGNRDGRRARGAAQRNREVGEVPANPDLLLVGLKCGAGGARLLVVEGKPIVGEVAYRLHHFSSGS